MTVAKQTWEQADIAAKKAVPEGLWVQCRKCGATIFGKTLEASLEVCPKCDHHHRVTARVRIGQLVDLANRFLDERPRWVEVRPGGGQHQLVSAKHATALPLNALYHRG